MADSTSTNESGQSDKEQNLKYDAILIQLSSQRPSDVFRGMEQIRQWLKDDPENRDVYGVLLDAVQTNREVLRDQVRNLFTEMMEKKKSKAAEEALAALPGGVQDLLADADDEYYAAEYEKAIQLYRRVLKLEPQNERAKEHLAKAEIKQVTGESTSGVPRAAEQFYRRARSYLAARDVVAARNLFNAAVEAARAKGVPYPDAEQTLNDMENLIKAEELKREANQLFEEGKPKEAFYKYEGAINLDPKNEQIQKELASLQNLWFAENELRRSNALKVFASLKNWQSVINDASLFISPNNRVLRFVENQIIGIQRYRLIFLIVLIASIIAGFFSLVPFMKINNMVGANASLTPTLQDATNFVLPTTPAPETIRPTLTIIPILSNTPTVISFETPFQSSTPPLLGTGYINKDYVSSWETPNGGLIESLGLYQPVDILEKIQVAGSVWYRCRWINQSGEYREGWILGDYITFGLPPTPGT